MTCATTSRTRHPAHSDGAAHRSGGNAVRNAAKSACSPRARHRTSTACRLASAHGHMHTRDLSRKNRTPPWSRDPEVAPAGGSPGALSSRLAAARLCQATARPASQNPQHAAGRGGRFGGARRGVGHRPSGSRRVHADRGHAGSRAVAHGPLRGHQRCLQRAADRRRSRVRVGGGIAAVTGSYRSYSRSSPRDRGRDAAGRAPARLPVQARGAGRGPRPGAGRAARPVGSARRGPCRSCPRCRTGRGPGQTSAGLRARRVPRGRGRRP